MRLKVEIASMLQRLTCRAAASYAMHRASALYSISGPPTAGALKHVIMRSRL
jgi:hypothetical protein